MTKIALYLLLFSLLALKGQAQVEPGDSSHLSTPAYQPLIKWLGQQAHPLKSVQAGSGFDDLSPLRTILTGVDFVGLGEATHGTREFFQAKHRLVEFLVTQLGFTTFAIEASYSRCQYINDYVLTGKGNLDTATVIQGFHTWRTQEVRALIQWLRNYNRKRPQAQKVRFVGYDIQNNELGARAVKAYFRRVQPARSPHVDSLMNQLVQAESDRKVFRQDSSTRASMRSLTRQVEHLLMELTLLQGEFTEKTGPTLYESTHQYLRVILQYFRAYVPQTQSISYWRDRYMAENIFWWHSQLPKGTKMVIWAHNGHIATDFLFEGNPSMGSYLREQYGKRYYALGFCFYEGRFQANDPDLANSPGWEEHSVAPAGAGDLAWFFAQSHQNSCYVNWRGVTADSLVGGWLTQRPVSMYSMGSLFSQKWSAAQYTEYRVLSRSFDGMLFIRTSTRARPLPMMTFSFD